MDHDKSDKKDGEGDAGTRSIIQRSVKENAAASNSLWLLSQSLQSEYKQTVSVVHIGSKCKSKMIQSFKFIKIFAHNCILLLK